MSTLELRQQLISKIQITEDEEILGGLLKMLEFELNNTEVYHLNNFQKEAIIISKQQIIDGEVYTEEEANKLTDEWLNG
jgi:hypothetical protein